MGFGTHLVNGIISGIVSVGATVATAGDDTEYGLMDLILAVAVSGFLSGFFTSYFADQ
ncbi:MAG: hypothetical protein ABEI76_06710 [Halobacteriales archaeon]